MKFILNKTSIYNLIITFTLFNYINNIFLVLDPYEKRCVYSNHKQGHVFSGNYYISGEQEDRNMAFINGPTGQRLWESRNRKDNSFNLQIDQEGEYILCFLSEYEKHLTVSFDFHDEKKKEQLLSVQSIESLNQVVHQIRKKLDVIHANMRNSLIRRSTHLDSKYILIIILYYVILLFIIIVTKGISTKINSYTIIKIAFLFFFGIFQFYMITNIFGGVKITNNINIMGSSETEMLNL